MVNHAAKPSEDEETATTLEDEQRDDEACPGAIVPPGDMVAPQPVAVSSEQVAPSAPAPFFPLTHQPSTTDSYKARFPRVASLVTHNERRRYLIELFRLGRFHGLQTAGHLALLWDDLGPLEFSELVTGAAMELNFRRGSDAARKVVLIGLLEKAVRMAVKNEDPKTVARLAEVWARVDGLTGEQGLLPASIQTEAMRLIAQELQRFPEAASAVHARLAAEDARKRAVLAPPVIDTTDHAAE